MLIIDMLTFNDGDWMDNHETYQRACRDYTQGRLRWHFPPQEDVDAEIPSVKVYLKSYFQNPPKNCKKGMAIEIPSVD